MHFLKLVALTAVQLIQQLIALPKNILDAFRDRHRQALLKTQEAERLDRIRNPSKYLGVP